MLLQQESEILNRENRSYFSLHCIHLETQFVYANMQILAEVVATLVATQIKGHQEASANDSKIVNRSVGAESNSSELYRYCLINHCRQDSSA